MPDSTTQLNLFQACAHPECDKPLESGRNKSCRGFCWNHYIAWRRKNIRTTATCGQCGKEYQSERGTRKYCSNACASVIGAGARSEAAYKRRSPLRRALESRSYPETVKHIKAKVAFKADTGCWEWLSTSRAKKGGKSYPTTPWSGEPVHRLVLEAKHGKPLGSQHAHHICANTMCVNPDHLQPVTHRENAAEMLARHSYLKRIRDLEHALAQANPNHPLLNHIEVA
jgi:hypothetical protein